MQAGLSLGGGTDMTAVSDRLIQAGALRRPGWPRFAAALALFAASVAVYWWFTLTYAGQWTHTDELVYWNAGRLALHHSAQLYSANLGVAGSKTPFIYPPFAAALLALASPASFAVWQAGLVIANLAAVPVIAYLSLGIRGIRGLRAAGTALALSAVAIWLQPVFLTNYFGQINLLLLVLVMADLALPDSSRWKGIGIGVAAGVKLTPLIFVPYLLASRRVRAGLVTVATFAVTLVIGLVLMPAASRVYWWQGKFTSPEVSPGRRQNQSLYGVALRLAADHVTAHRLWLAAAVVVGVAGLAVAVVASRRGLELLGIVVCAITGLLVSEISWTHHWLWVVPALALIPGRGWLAARIAALVAVVVVFFHWVVPHETWTVLPGWLQRVMPDVLGHIDGVVFVDSHDGFVIAGLLTIAGAAAYLWITWRRDGVT
jgi:alpha-1,2-mannosyltransferase